MSVTTNDDEHEVFSCDQCGKTSAPGIGLPEGWVQIAVRGKARMKDQHKQFCSGVCVSSFDRGQS